MADKELENKAEGISEDTQKVSNFFKIDLPKGEADATVEKKEPIQEKTELQPEAKTEVKVEDKTPAKQEVKSAPKEYTDDELMDLIRARGLDKEITKSAKSKEELATERENQKMAWAFQNNKISSKEYTAFLSESNDLADLVYRDYLNDQKKEDPSLTDSEIFEEFQNKYGLDAEPDTRQHKNGQKLIQSLGNQILKDKYKNVFSLEENYTTYESGENTRKAEEKKIIAESPKYRANVEEIFGHDLKSITIKTSSGDWELEIPEAVLGEVKSLFLTPDVAMSYIKEGKDKEAIKAIAELSLYKQALPFIIEDAQKKYFLKHQKGVKGVPEANVNHSEQKKAVSEETSKVASFFKMTDQIAN